MFPERNDFEEAAFPNAISRALSEDFMRLATPRLTVCLSASNAQRGVVAVKRGVSSLAICVTETHVEWRTETLTCSLLREYNDANSKSNDCAHYKLYA